MAVTRVVAVALALLTWGSPNVWAQWHQDGHDVARTGNVPYLLPESDDVAFTVDLPQDGNANPTGTGPIVVGRNVYVPLNQYLPSTNNPVVGRDAGVIIRVNLDDPKPERIFDIEGSIVGLASDGRSVFVLSDEGIFAAVNISSGARAWRISLVALDNGDALSPDQSVMGYDYCAPLGVANDAVYAACMEFPGGCCAADMDIVLHKVSSKDGTLAWTWRRSTSVSEYSPRGTSYEDALGYAVYTALLQNPPTKGTSFHQLNGLTVLGEQAILSITQVTDGRASFSDVVGIYDSNGTTAWRRSNEAILRAYWGASAQGGNGPQIAPAVTGNSSAMFVKFHTLTRWRLPSPKYYDDGYKDIRQGNVAEPDVGSGMAFDGTLLYATSLHLVHRIAPSIRGLDIQKTAGLPEEDLSWGRGGLVLSDNCLLARGFRGAITERDSAEPWGAANVLFCLDPFSLEPIWRKEFYGRIRLAATDGLVIVQSGMKIHVVGHTPASLGIAFRVTNQYPTPGESVSIDLGSSRPGLQGPPDRYGVDWGDGTPIRWQESPVLAHTYSLANNFRARLLIENEAGQTASEWLEFYVGQDDPRKSYVELQFTAKYQERTFFILGAILTLLFAVAGVIRIRIRHARFQRELRALDDMYARNRADPDLCVGILEERRHHVRDLLLRRRLDESHVGTLERRVDELHRMVRMQIVDERFEFLPLGLVKRLRAVLEDGLVTRLEQSHIEDVLERDPTLLPVHKQRIRKLLANWSSQDEGRAKSRAPRVKN